ncbi:RHS repeat-associated core domain-containing protein, partial [Escherichia marmotae]
QREQRRTTFVWEGFRLLQETTWQGKRTYLYDAEQPYTPVAAVTGRGESRKIWYYHTDVTGTVQEVSAADGTLVWAGYQAGFGENRGDISNSGAYFEQPLRLPGQYYDEETGLHYNLFRYYAPECGRFVSQDPIGLNGGINLYAYVKNPLTWIDPLGLAGCNAQQRRNISDLRNGKDVTVRSVDEARALLDNMPDLRPHVDSFPARSGELYSGTKFSDVWKQPAGTYRGDLYNVKNPLSDVVHNSKNPLHDNNPHYNIIFGDGTKAGIIIVP